MRSRVTVPAIGVAALAILVIAAAVTRFDRSSTSSLPSGLSPPSGVTLASIGDRAPPAPLQWAGAGPPPTNQWWSSAMVGPGTDRMWPQPLAVEVAENGTVLVSYHPPLPHDDGTMATPFVPAVEVGPTGDGETRVIEAGAFHVRLQVGETELTLAQGSPFVELVVPAGTHFAIAGMQAGERSAPAGESVSVEAEGVPWVLGADGPVTWEPIHDGLVPGTERDTLSVAVGPVPMGSEAWGERAAWVAEHPIVSTSETLDVLDGSVRQTLEVRRRGSTHSPMALFPHHVAAWSSSDADDGHGAELGSLQSAVGPLPIRDLSALELDYPLPPVLWSPVGSFGGGATAASLEADLGAGPAPGGGSYFGGKRTWYAAQLAELALLPERGESGALPLRSRALDEVRAVFDRLKTGNGPSLVWDDRWRSLLMLPSEFGLAEELNDHHLQYGYWVAAASVVAEADPDWAERFGPLVESLIADFGTDRRAWNPYEGHTWASGLAPFADGNNLESISESTHAWWAAARWFTVTGQPDRATPHLARFAIEGIVAGGQWLPEEVVEGRPWTGVVWSAKTDHATWFSPADEAALGIRLLPLGPASLARYADQADLDATRARWNWCQEGAGCTSLWSNLLDSDAAVAGLRLPAGPEPEDSTSSSMLGWWSDLWSASAPALDHACTVGAVARRTPDGVVILAANPTAGPLPMRCHDATGAEIWRATLQPGERRQDSAL